VIVVGCGKSKLAHAAPARELYTGSLFRMARRYAEATGEPWVILSGWHGVVLPSEPVEPYDRGLPETASARQRWAQLAARQIADVRAKDTVGLLLGRPVEILAGERYAAPLAAELDALDIEWREPLAGLGLGERLARLKRMTNERYEQEAGKWGKDSPARNTRGEGKQ